MARTEREKDALTRDTHAWVGLPIGIETLEEYRLKLKEAEPENVVRLKAKSPYNARVVNFDNNKDDSEKKEKVVVKPKHKIKRVTSATAGSYKARLSSSENMAASSGSEKDFGASSGSEREGFDRQDSDVELVHSPATGPSPLKRSSLSKTPGRVLDEGSFVKELMKYGYDPTTMDPVMSRGLARLGTISYDMNSGRQIIHKGNNRWVGTRDKNFVVQYELPPQALVDQEKTALEDGDSYSASVSANPFGEYNLSTVKPRIVQHRSGAITLTNPALLNKKSRFLRDHRSMFLENYTHHNLSDYSGLLSSTYFDLTLHAQGIRAPSLGFGSVGGDNSSLEDDMTDFNYIQSQSPSQSQAPRGFTQSFLTDTAASLARTKSDSKLYPTFDGPGALATAAVLGMSTAEGSLMTAGGSAVRFTAAGHPIRGARKPHAESAFPSAQVGRPRRKPASAYTYDNFADSYKGQAGSAMNSERYAREGSQKSALSASMDGEKSGKTITLQQGDPGASWKSSAWGRVKKGVEDMSAAVAQDPALQRKLYRAATNASIASSSVGFDDDLDFTAGQRHDEMSNNNDNRSDYDSDEEMWRSRSVYKAGQDAILHTKLWPKRPKMSYKLRYTWIPQPLLHNAVNNLYYEKTVWDYRKEFTDNNPYDFKKEILQGKESYQKKVEKSSMLSLVSDSNTNSAGTAPRHPPAYSNDLSRLRGADVSSKSGLVSPSDSSVASSKYYKNFVGNGTSGLRDGWDTYKGDSPAKLQYGDSKLGLGPGVMITSMLDADSSVGSLSDEEGTPKSLPGDTPTRHKKAPGGEDLRQQVLKKGLSFSGRIANFDAQSSNNGSSVGSTPGSSPAHAGFAKPRQTITAFSPTPRGKTGGKSGTQTPQKESYFKFPSPLSSSENLQALAQRQDFDLASGMSSPGASVSAAGGNSGAGSSAPSVAGDAWETTSATPTSTFLSARATSKSGGKLQAHQEDSGDEFAHAHHSRSYLGAKPAELSAGLHTNAMFVEKRGTSTKDIKVNHYLNKKIRETAHNVPEVSSAHLVLQPPPPEDAKKVTTHAPKYKFKPVPPAGPPPPDGSPAAETSAKSNYPSHSKMVRLSLPAEVNPSTSQRGASFNNADAAASDNDMPAAGTSMKRMGKGDSIHPYHFL